MANTDPAEWRLYASDLTTQTDILPIKSSHIDMVLNEAGSGEVTIPLDTQAGGNVAVGNFVALYYRGSYRTGFFVDNLKYTDISNSEISERMVSMSGAGALAILNQSVIWAIDGISTTRTFTAVTKASILITLLNEAQARGELSTLTWSFSASVDSASDAWTDSETYELNVGMSLLDVAKQFAGTGGFEYTIDLSSGSFILGAYSAGRGSDISSTTYFRIGEQCEEVGRDTRGDEIFNYYLVKWKNGYVAVSDATSISAYGIRSTFLSLEQAQSSASAITYASAKLALTKNPKTNKVIKVYDGINPRLFVNYDLGDTVSLDRFGTVSTDVIKGISADFDGTEFCHVVVDFNYILYDNEMRLSNQMDWLTNQWTTAHDANLLETQFFARIGSTAEVYALAVSGNTLYIAGEQNIAPWNVGIKQIDLQTWQQSQVGTYTGGHPFRSLCVIGTNLYAAGEDEKIWKFDGTNWTNIGTIVDDGIAAVVHALITDGTDLYVGTSHAVSIGGTAGASQVFKYTVSGGSWSAIGAAHSTDWCWDLCFFGGVLYGAFLGTVSGGVQKYSAGSWSSNLAGITDECISIAATATELVIGEYQHIYTWDGVAGSATLIGTLGGSAIPYSIATYLNDIYIGGDFTTIDSVTGFNNLGKYSGGLWYPIGTGTTTTGSDKVSRVIFHNADFIFAGLFSEANGYPTDNIAAFMTSFSSMSNYLQGAGANGFDLAYAISNAPTNAPTALDSWAFYDASTGAISRTVGATGTGKIVFDTAPTLVTPTLGVATATSINKVAITAPATGATLTIANGKTLTINETLTLTAGASGQTFTLPAASDTLAGLGTANTFTVGQVINAHLSIGAGVSPNANQIFRSVETFTDASADATNINANINVTQTAANNSNVFRGFNGGVTNTNHAFNLTSATGMRGIQASAIHNGSGTVTGAVGYFVQLRNDGSGTITNAYNHYIQAPSNGGGGAITNLYGMYIEALTAGGTLNYALYTNSGLVHFGDTVDIASGKNLGVGTTTFGTSATNTLALFNGTVPSTSPADTVQLFSVDLSAGNATLGIRTETAVVTESVTSDRTLSVKINGTTYKICLKA